MSALTVPVAGISRREAWAALVYFVLYLAYLTVTLESELLHWVTLVALPVAIVTLLRPRSMRAARSVLDSFGLRRDTLRRGLGVALLLVVVIGVFQGLGGSVHGQQIRDMVRSGRVLWTLPVAFVAMLATAGFTEEFFFRGFLQTRLTRLTQSRVAGWLGSALLFGVYHIPYAYLNQNWPSHGDPGAAVAAAMGQGGIAGVILGGLYLASRGNLLACVVLHAGINATWFMTSIRFGH